MDNFRDEFDRVINNPDNLIMSKDLEGVLSDNTSFKSSDNTESAPGYILLSGKDYVFEFLKLKKLPETKYIFKGFVPKFPLADFIKGSDFVLFLFNSSFEVDKDEPVIYKSDGILTFTGKRIISNEEVSV